MYENGIIDIVEGYFFFSVNRNEKFQVLIFMDNEYLLLYDVLCVIKKKKKKECNINEIDFIFYSR